MMIQRFWRSRRGNYGMMLALVTPMLLTSVGLAVDFSTMVKSQSKLQNALDSAVLAASRIGDKNISREEMFHNFMSANMQNVTDLENIVASIDIDQGLNYINSTGTASADIRLAFGFLWGGTKQVSARSTAFESTNKLEVVLALDNTGSMGEARMKELRKAATSLVDILQMAGSQSREVRAALVPFVTAVNVKGTGFKPEWIDWNAQAKYHGANFEPIVETERTGNGNASDTGKANGQGKGKGLHDGTETVTRTVNHFDLFKALNVDWKGCVEARPVPLNFSDEAPDPANPDTLFVPYFAPDEPGNARKSGDSSTAYNNTYLNDMVEGTDLQRQRSTVKYDRNTPSYIRENTGSLTNGPNYACPTPIVPLTTDFAKLKSEIAGMIHWFGSGTNVSEGLAWALRVLSPGEPYSQGAPFRAEGTTKHVVVFTDGENTVFGASSQAINKSDYGAYSFVDQGRIDPNRGKALTKVNDWTLDVCNQLKNNGVEVFTVLLGADTAANRKLYSACASTPEHYYPTSDVSKLDDVFRKIASRIAQLYVSG
jgi:Flp pilus assembly protein TadG